MSRLHERMMSFFANGGHDHDGINSSPVKVAEGSIQLSHLSESLVDYLTGLGGGSGGLDPSGLMAVPDLVIETPTITAGGSYTGQTDWVNICVIRFMRILMSVDTECTITFYHKGTFAEEDREFRARNCANRFMWEGPWVHYDEDNSNQVYYRIQNTGNTASSFRLTLKSGTMVSNRDIDFIERVSVGESDITGRLSIKGGAGISVTTDEDTVTVSATGDIEVVNRQGWALTPLKPVNATSSAGAIGNIGYLYDGYTHDTNRYVNYGSGMQWIMVDIGEARTLGAIQIIFYFGDGRVYNDVKVEISIDGQSFQTVKSSSPVWGVGEGLWITNVQGHIVRYIRVWTNGSSVNTGNHMVKCIPYAIADKA